MRKSLAATIAVVVVSLFIAPSAAQAVAFRAGHGETVLAGNGYDAPFLVLWAVGGALVLAVVLTVSISIARRNAAAAARPAGRPTGRHRA